MTRQGDYPRWVLAIAEVLREVFAVDGVIVGVSVEGRAAPLFPLGLAGILDSARNAGACSLLRAGYTRDLGRIEDDAQNALVSVVLTDAREFQKDDSIELRADGEPACHLAVVVERALQRGSGSIDLEAIWRHRGRTDRLTWRCALKDHSIARSVDAAAARLADLVGHIARRLGGQTSEAPRVGSSPVPDMPLTAARGGNLGRAFRHMAHRLTAHDQWAFRVYQNLLPDHLWPTAGSQFIDFVPPIDKIWADPFVARDDGLLWVFFEEDSIKSPKGRIVCVSIDASGYCSEPVVVLEDSSHLSYPQVFKCDGKWYMLPESGARGDLVLYRAKKFPFEWEPVAELLQQVRLADATLHRNHAGWWLTASGIGQSGGSGCDESPYDMRLYDTLHVYHSSALTSGWQPMSLNPLRVDAATSRPAGPWFQWQGQWIRPVQDCRGRYGRAVHLLAVESISMQGINERLLATLGGGGRTNCVHTYSRVGGDLAIDWNVWRFRSDHFRSRVDPEFEFHRHDAVKI